jgi:hypothetical protein
LITTINTKEGKVKITRKNINNVFGTDQFIIDDFSENSFLYFQSLIKEN